MPQITSNVERLKAHAVNAGKIDSEWNENNDEQDSQKIHLLNIILAFIFFVPLCSQILKYVP